MLSSMPFVGGTTRVRSIGVVVALLALVFAGAGPVSAQAVERAQRQAGRADERVWTLADVLAAAREGAPAVGTAQAQALVVKTRVMLAEAARWPTLSATLSTAAGAQNSHSLLGGEVCVDPTLGVCAAPTVFGDASGGAGIDARWTLFDFSRRASSIASAERSAEAAAWDVESVRDSAAHAAAAAFLAVAAHQELVSIRTAIVAGRQRALDVAAGRVRLGSAPPIEETRAKVALDTARLDVAQANAALDDAHASLSRALGLPGHARLQIVANAPLDVVADPTRAADLAQQHRAELRAQKTRVAASEANLQGAHAERWPTLQGAASLSARAQGNTSGRNSGTGREGGTVGVVLSIPLFDPAISASIDSAAASVAAERALHDQRVLDMRADAAQAAIAVRAQQQSLQLSEALRAQAEANLAQAEGRYQAGAGAMLELIDAQTQQANAALSVVQARYQLEVGKVRLLATIGVLGD